MRIGVPAEIKVHEYRVGLTPGSVAELTAAGHEVMVQTRAGAGIGFMDRDYQRAGASIAPDAATVFRSAELIVKVKEPQAVEYSMLRSGQILFTYLHLAADRAQADALMACGVSAIAYETVTAAGGGLPLLAPMSEVAGRMAVQVGAKCLEKGSRWHRQAARRRSGRGAGEGRHPRRRYGRRERGVDRARHAGRRDDSGQIGEPTALARGPLRLGSARGNGESADDPRIRRRSRPRDRRRAGSGRRRAETRQPRDGARNARWIGRGGRGNRPGRLFRNEPAHDPLGADLHRGRCGALLRHEHAGRGCAHVCAGAQQRDPPLRQSVSRQRTGRR